MNTDPAELYDDILAAARAALAEVRAHVGDDLRAMALFSDSDGVTVGEAFDTRSHLAGQVQAHPDDAAYYEFSPAEWALDGLGATALFDELSRRAFAGHDEVSSDDPFDEHDDGHHHWRAGLFETCVRVLEALRPEVGDLLLVFAVSDDFREEDDVAWMRCTSPAHAGRFAAYAATDATDAD